MLFSLLGTGQLQERPFVLNSDMLFSLLSTGQLEERPFVLNSEHKQSIQLCVTSILITMALFTTYIYQTSQDINQSKSNKLKLIWTRMKMS